MNTNKKDNKNKVLKNNVTVKSIWEWIIDGIKKLRIPSELVRNTIFPPHDTGKLTFVLDNNVITSAGDYAIVDLRVNSPYDVDYRSGGLQPSGFATMMTAYNFVLVKRFRLTLKVDNNESTNVFVSWILRDTQPSAILASRGAVINSTGITPALKPKAIPASSGMDSVYFRHGWITPGAVIGDELGYIAQRLNYSCPANANPSQIVWGGIVVWAEVAAGTLNQGITCSLELEMDCDFYSLRDSIA